MARCSHAGPSWAGGNGHTVTVPRIVLWDEGGVLGRLSIVGLLGGRQLGVGLSGGRQLGVGLSRSCHLGLGLRGAACPDVLKGPGTWVSLPVAHYSDSTSEQGMIAAAERNYVEY